MQVTVFATNIWVTVFIVIMQIGVSVAIMQVVFSAVHYTQTVSIVIMLVTFLYSYVGERFK